MHIYNTSGFSVLKQSRLQQSPDCSLGEFMMKEMPSFLCSLPTKTPSRLHCLIVWSFASSHGATPAENQLNLTGIYAPCSFTGKQKFRLFFILSKWHQPPLHCNCTSRGQRRSENNEIITQWQNNKQQMNALANQAQRQNISQTTTKWLIDLSIPGDD